MFINISTNMQQKVQKFVSLLTRFVEKHGKLLLLLYNMDVSCHRPFLPGTSLEPAVIPTAQASSFTLQYFPYYV